MLLRCVRSAEEMGMKLGKYVDKFSNIVDMEGLSLKHRKLMPFLKAVARVDEVGPVVLRGCICCCDTPLHPSLSHLWRLSYVYATDSGSVCVFVCVRACWVNEQKYYPECLGHTFIVNAPWVFTGLWSLFKLVACDFLS